MGITQESATFINLTKEGLSAFVDLGKDGVMQFWQILELYRGNFASILETLETDDMTPTFNLVNNLKKKRHFKDIIKHCNFCCGRITISVSKKDIKLFAIDSLK